MKIVDKWKNIFKSWAGVPVLILLALLVIWSINSLFPILRNKFEVWQVKRAYEKLSEPYYKDTYGGKTPEETYDLFISALKKGDVELASRYFMAYKQDNWFETLEKYKQSGYLNNFVKELENTKTKWSRVETDNPNIVGFRYQSLIEKDTEAEFEGQKINIPAGNYTNETVFNKYPNGVWKIEGL